MFGRKTEAEKNGDGIGLRVSEKNMTEWQSKHDNKYSPGFHDSWEITVMCRLAKIDVIFNYYTQFENETWITYVIFSRIPHQCSKIN